MEIQKILAPFDSKEMLDLIELTFGKDERELEARQLDGSESEYNSDYVYIAKEGNDILGTLHITVPKEFSKICGVSAVLTTEAARGKGVGNALFSKATEDIDSMGIELSVLGTSNPIAAKLYSKYGFGYCFGSGIMMRFKSGHLVDYNKKYLDDSAIEIKVEEGTPSARIPIVPLSIYKTNFLINDINIALFNSDVFTQPSCMGLFPRYLSVIDKGGSFYIAKESAGAIGAVLSVIPDDCGEYRADFFFAEGFKKSINEMIELAKKKHGRIYFEVAKKDVYKMEILKSNGFNKTINSVFEHNGFKISTLKFYE